MGSALRRAAKNGEDPTFHSLGEWRGPVVSTKTSWAWATIPIPKPGLTLPGSVSEARNFEQISLQERPRPRLGDWPGRGRMR